MIICIEGIDGSGKSTQVERLRAALPDAIVYKFPDYSTPLGAAIKARLEGREGWMLREPDSFIQLTVQEELPPEEIKRIIAEMRTYHGYSKAPVAVITPDMSFDVAGHSPSQAEPLVLQAMLLANRLEHVDVIAGHCLAGRIVILDRSWPSAMALGVAEGIDATWLERINAGDIQADLYILLDVDVTESFARRPRRDNVWEADPGRLERVTRAYRELWARRQTTDTLLWTVKDQLWSVIDGTLPPTDIHKEIRYLLRRLS